MREAWQIGAAMIAAKLAMLLTLIVIGWLAAR
jgi:hypothetical protein